MPRSAHAAASSRASTADVVVWSTRVDPVPIPASTPSAASVTARTSSSLPTHVITSSAPSAASAGVGADELSCVRTHWSAFERVRL